MKNGHFLRETSMLAKDCSVNEACAQPSRKRIAPAAAAYTHARFKAAGLMTHDRQHVLCMLSRMHAMHAVHISGVRHTQWDFVSQL